MESPNKIYAMYIKSSNLSFKDWLATEKTIYMQKKGEWNSDDFAKWLDIRYRLHREHAFFNTDGSPKFWDTLKTIVTTAGSVFTSVKEKNTPEDLKNPKPEKKILGMPPSVAYPVIAIATIALVVGIVTLTSNK